MANFQQATGAAGTGYNAVTNQFILPVDNRRSVQLFGGGGAGVALTVSVADASKVRLTERPATRSGTALPADTREFWIDGVASGTTSLFARLPDGRDFAAPLQIQVTAGADRAPLADAFRASRDTLTRSIDALEDLKKALAASQRVDRSFLGPKQVSPDPLTAEQKRIMTCVSRWLNLPDYDPNLRARTSPGALGPRDYEIWVATTSQTISKATTLMRRNLALSVSIFVRVPESIHAQTWGDLALGVEGGEAFYSHDGPNCRNQVLIHELFHLLGVGHGIDPLNGPTIHRTGITPDQSLNSADNLAQLTADITIRKTDCCVRAHD